MAIQRPPPQPYDPLDRRVASLLAMTIPSKRDVLYHEARRSGTRLAETGFTTTGDNCLLKTGIPVTMPIMRTADRDMPLFEKAGGGEGLTFMLRLIDCFLPHIPRNSLKSLDSD